MKKCHAFLLLSFFFTLTAYAQVITRLAGNDTTGYSGDGGLAIAAKLNNPLRVRPDNNGNIYIADNGNSRIRKIDAAGIITTIAGNGAIVHSGDGEQATAAGISYPQSVAIDSSGNLYIAEDTTYGGSYFSLSWIRKVNTSGIITTIAGNGIVGYSGDGGPATAAGFNCITDVAVDNSGNIYIADGFNNRIRKINAASIITTIAGNGMSGYSGDGGPATAAQLSFPQAIAVDGAGNVYIADKGNLRIRKVNAAGIITTTAGQNPFSSSGDGGPATAAGLEPEDVAVDNAGNVYIADYYYSSIRKINIAGIITTIAGDELIGESGDGGPATAAELYHPVGVAVDDVGNVYIAEPSEPADVIRKVSANNTGLTTPGSPKRNNTLQVWPDPNDGNFNINILSATNDVAQVTIANVAGEKVKEFTTVTNNPSEVILNVPAGTYFVTAITAYGNWTQKIILLPN